VTARDEPAAPACRVRDTSHPIGAATTQQMKAEVVAINGGGQQPDRGKSGSVNSVTKILQRGAAGLVGEGVRAPATTSAI